MKNKRKIAVLASGWSIDYVIDVTEGIKSAVEKENTDVYLFTPYTFQNQLKKVNYTGYNIFSIIDYKEFDGVIILANILDETDFLKSEIERIKESGIPAISLLKKIDGIDFIGCDDNAGYYELLQHTCEKHNCKSYAYIGGPENSSESQLRYKTFLQFINDNNLILNEQWIILDGDYSPEFAEAAARELLKDKDNFPDIIVCINDDSALAVLRIAKKLNLKVPQDLKIIGYDNIKLSAMSIPSISTCDAQNFKIGKQAAEHILNINSCVLDNPYLPSVPVFRQSCGCASEINTEQEKLFTYTIDSNTETKNFISQLRHMEDLFVYKNDRLELLKELGNFFEKHHYFEGPDFSILLQQDYMNAFLSNDFSHKSSNKITGNVTSLVQIVDGKKIDPCIFGSEEIVPETLKENKSSLFIIFPLVILESLLGYTVIRNSTKIIEAKRAFQWMRNLCGHLETFRQKCSYKLLSEKYLNLATIDALSGALNRFGYNTFANDLLLKNKYEKKSTVIIFIDINSMKIINDKYGHLQGDFAVKTVAASIHDFIPENWIVIRYGGDEFVVMGDADSMSGDDFCSIFEKNLKDKKNKMKLPYKLTASTGYKVYGFDSDIELDTAITEVDELMYINKNKYHKKTAKN